MVRLTSSREQKLLRWNECSIRGASPKYSDNVDEEESDEFRPTALDISEEDNLFLVDSPISMRALPLYLNPSSRSPVNVAQDEFFRQRKATKMLKTTKMLSGYIFPQASHIRFSQRFALSRFVNPSFTNQSSIVDSDLLLDYLPFLRGMAVQERISDCIFQAQEILDPDAASSTNHRKRETRRSKKLGREQYFEKIIPSYVFADSERTAKEITNQLADLSLLY
jgi:hypothetical protein